MLSTPNVKKNPNPNVNASSRYRVTPPAYAAGGAPLSLADASVQAAGLSRR
jgi:hypothetical protein